MNSFADFIWLMLWAFFLFIWIMILVQILTDLFRDHTTSGWVKAIWVIFLVFIPFLTALIYIVARHQGMAERQLAAQKQAQEQFNDYVKTVGNSTSSADQIAKAHELLTSGAITQAEFDAIKAKAINA